MSLRRVTVIDKVEILAETGHVLVRHASRILEGDTVHAQTFHRTSFAPGDDVSQQPPTIRAIAAALWSAGPAGFQEDGQA